MSDLERRQRRHVLYTWTAQRGARPIEIKGGEGAWFFDHAGERWLDFESQVYNVNAGHGERRITEAIVAQARENAIAHPAAVFEVKAALGEALAAITPGDLDHFFFCLSGAEANENALKIARLVTGRSKVIARRRSYHGASMGALSLTGDNRRWAVEPGLWGVVRAEDPYCYRCPFGRFDGEGCALECATHLEHVIQMEGPQRIAAVFMEGVTGANGGFIPPAGYWPKVREICDRYGILLVSDEVFSGFGRTGEWFAVNHWGVVPDMITMAKGLTGGYASLGAVAVSDRIAAHFEDEKLWCGLTSYAHPIACAAAKAAIEVYQADHLIERAKALEPVLQEEMDRIYREHEIIGDARSIGLFGTMELVVDRETRQEVIPANMPTIYKPFEAALTAAFLKRRLHMPFRGNDLFICPPLCISEADLRYGIRLIDEALTETMPLFRQIRSGELTVESTP
ncbi:aminotransferase class III-fold pyridoxal phosphate-dependent enzyme [Myxococcota bacterium]|nr:aminotransferase class III-fold pyridoxal phosphate-dependent enzyme [Myxococcota bacterium]